MSGRPTLAFNRDDADLAATLSKRAKSAADTIRKLLPALAPATGRRATRVADELAAIAGALHPVTARFATYGAGKRCHVGIIDGRSMTLYRLLPCPKAGAYNMARAQSVTRHAVKEWPTLALALAFARIETKHRRREDALSSSFWKAQRQRERRHSQATRRLIERAAKVTP